MSITLSLNIFISDVWPSANMKVSSDSLNFQGFRCHTIMIGAETYRPPHHAAPSQEESADGGPVGSDHSLRSEYS